MSTTLAQPHDHELPGKGGGRRDVATVVQPVFPLLVRRLAGVSLLVGGAGCLVMTFTGWMPLATWLCVSLASGMIGLTASLPCLLRDQCLPTDGVPQSERDFDLFIREFSGCVALRLLGTVALIGACRYLMGGAILPVAIAIVGWYLLLTSVEVFTMTQRVVKKPDLPSVS